LTGFERYFPAVQGSNGEVSKLGIRLTVSPLFNRMIGLHNVPHDTTTFFALTMTSRTVLSVMGPSTPP
jgi:hypothetical protein